MRIAAIALALLAATGCSRSSLSHVELEGGRLQLPAGFAPDPEAQRRSVEGARSTTPEALEKAQAWLDAKSGARVILLYQDVAAPMASPRAAVEEVLADGEGSLTAAGYQLQVAPIEMHDTWAAYQLTATTPLLGGFKMYQHGTAGLTQSGHLLAWTVTCLARDPSVCAAILTSFEVDSQRLSSLLPMR